jgi:fumarate reductase subunit C
MIWLIIYLVGMIVAFGMVWMAINILKKQEKFSEDFIKKYSWAAYILIGVFWPLLVLFSFLLAPYRIYKKMKE